MRFRIALFQLLPLLTAGAAPTLQVLNVNGGEARRAIATPDGGTLVIGTYSGLTPTGALNSANVRKGVNLVKVPVVGAPATLPVKLGSGNDLPADAAIDKNGNIWLVGTTDSDDFPLVNPLISAKKPYEATSFVTKLDATGSRILFSTFLGGHQLTGGTSKATAITLDSSGNAYILGTTTEADFPQTSTVLGTGGPAVQPFNELLVYTFVVKISPDGKLGYSVLLGADKINCSGGSRCIGKSAQTTGNAISVEANGNVTVAGSTNASNFPATPGSFQPSCACPDFRNLGFVARISATGNKLVWATYLGYTGVNTVGLPTSTVTSLALDAVGNAYVAGTNYGTFPTTPGAIQTILASGGQSGFTSKLSSDGGSLLYSTYLGGPNTTSVSGLALNAAGRVWIAGTDFTCPGSVAQLGSDYVVELNAGATAFLQVFRLPNGTVTQAPAFDSNGNLLLLASQGTLVRLNPMDGLSGTGVLGFGNAASFQVEAGAGPGELVSIYGVGLGPATGISAVPTGGMYPTTLGGVQVLVGSKPAPLLYVGANQINFQMPFQYYPNTLEVITATTRLGPITIGSRSSLGLFQLAGGAAAALNQDGSVNSPANPAAPGSVISLFATGLEESLILTEGAVWPGPKPFSLSFLNIKVTTLRGQGSLPILYAGAAPGLINGVTQLNVQLPTDFQDPVLTLIQDGFFGAKPSNPVQVFVH